jgi:hypothetical protein
MDKDAFHKSPPPNHIVSRPNQETPGKEGTMGGTPPLNARAGIQSARKDGVLDVIDEKPTVSDNAVTPQAEDKRDS